MSSVGGLFRRLTEQNADCSEPDAALELCFVAWFRLPDDSEKNAVLGFIQRQ
ncbi:hypothetical protein [Paractinoplanes hotanensis]|uniref:Uncharacterized protein n=1 Tax=Paractinoplanes hotanensis TaxID=2906497 RepID=A0ABT0YC53_9ACTN|nr:hypothetical protein [Actinoplanes hotanensis]MCM4083623.1 hypothetical protein [Actinoplanes hotanensis]